MLKEQPAVADAVCFGIDDEKYGQVVVLPWSVARRPAARSCAKVRESLADYKVPKVIHVVGEIPRTARQAAASGSQQLQDRPRGWPWSARAMGGYVGACLARGGCEAP